MGKAFWPSSCISPVYFGRLLQLRGRHAALLLPCPYPNPLLIHSFMVAAQWFHNAFDGIQPCLIIHRSLLGVLWKGGLSRTFLTRPDAGLGTPELTIGMRRPDWFESLWQGPIPASAFESLWRNSCTSQLSSRHTCTHSHTCICIQCTYICVCICIYIYIYIIMRAI